jgi:hypothetical protein
MGAIGGAIGKAPVAGFMQTPGFGELLARHLRADAWQMGFHLRR